MDSMENHIMQLTIAVIGDSGVGKTSITKRFTQNKHLTHLPTTGVMFEPKRNIRLNGKTIQVQMMDTAGAEQFMSMTRQFYRNPQGFIIVYDITDKKTFLNIDKWLSEVMHNAKEDADILIVGSKSDLKMNRTVLYKEAKKFSVSHGFHYVETSAKDGDHVDLAIETLAASIMNRINTQALKTRETHVNDKHTNTIRVTDIPVQEAKNSCCHSNIFKAKVSLKVGDIGIKPNM